MSRFHLVPLLLHEFDELLMDTIKTSPLWKYALFQSYIYVKINWIPSRVNWDWKNLIKLIFSHRCEHKSKIGYPIPMSIYFIQWILRLLLNAFELLFIFLQTIINSIKKFIRDTSNIKIVSKINSIEWLKTLFCGEFVMILMLVNLLNIVTTRQLFL